MDDLIRRNTQDGYLLSVGEPYFLQKFLKFDCSFGDGPYHYPITEGEPGLLKELQTLYPNKHIVITIGAKQALLAAMFALKKTYVKLDLYHKPPYWPSFPILARLCGMDLNPTTPSENLRADIVTSPNNPDGRQIDNLRASCQIYDASYASFVYGWNRIVPDYNIAVYSAAKLLGLSGIRVGWLITDNEDLAKDARYYVEQTTSGVPVPNQNYVANALRIRQPGRILSGARYYLLENGHIFNTYLGKLVDEVHGVPNEQTGMFAWFQVGGRYVARFQDALKTAKVHLVKGESCGMTEAGWFRMSMGHTHEYTEAALKAIVRAI